MRVPTGCRNRPSFTASRNAAHSRGSGREANPAGSAELRKRTESSSAGTLHARSRFALPNLRSTSGRLPGLASTKASSKMVAEGNHPPWKPRGSPSVNPRQYVAKRQSAQRSGHCRKRTGRRSQLQTAKCDVKICVRRIVELAELRASKEFPPFDRGVKLTGPSGRLVLPTSTWSPWRATITQARFHTYLTHARQDLPFHAGSMTYASFHLTRKLPN